MKKLTVLVAAAAGYVLGARAGRERYDQIKAQVTKVWHNPTVQDTVDGAQEQAKHAASGVASTVGSKVADAAHDVKAKVTDKVSHSDSDAVVDPDPVQPVPPTAPGGAPL